MNVADRVERTRARIRAAAARAGRDPAEVTLVAVAKTFSADAVMAAVEAGVTDVGENRAQELMHKHRVVGDRVRWHFVGPLQTNKVRHVVGIARLVHSVDRFALAEAIARRAATLGIDQDVLVEVNLAGERSKHGALPAEAPALAEAAAGLHGIRVRGLMAIPPLPDDPEDARPYYRALAELRDVVARRVPGARELSMGMTRDLEVAVEEGATLVRVGEAVFGPRGAR